MGTESHGDIKYLRVTYFDRKDKVERNLPVIDIRDNDQLGDLYRTIVAIVREGRISDEEANQLRNTLVNDLHFNPASYFINDTALEIGIEGLFKDLEDRKDTM